MRNISFEEDAALKKFIRKPRDQKPSFNWREVVSDSHFDGASFVIDSEGKERHLDIAEVAETIGEALADLLLARQVKDIYNDQNRQFVADVTKEVKDNLQNFSAAENFKKFSSHDLYSFIEKALLNHEAHDVAKSLVLLRAHKYKNGSVKLKDSQPKAGNNIGIRLIRRNSQVVPWDQNKVEIAVRKAFLSLQLDSSPAIDVAEAVTARLQDIGRAFVNIEDIQDVVQEELMRQGHYKVAEAYILYRAHRSLLRSQADENATEDTRQESMILVTEEDGQTSFWDPIELRKRIEFSMIGLDLCLDNDQIEAELRRSLYAEMTREDLKKTIILNSRTLIEQDADFAKFAARILLSYIYEEVLGWNIAKDGIEQLKAAHHRQFRKYIERAVEIERLSPKMLKYDLKKITDAIDPSADLDFDYLGIQTLYDRYLIVDKTLAKSTRMETPQFFWMRIAMGLFIEEKKDAEDWIIKLYNLYKSRRFCSSTPTLFNAGTCHSQLSSCFLYKVDDSIESIMYRGIAENAFLSKWAGGLGGSWTAVRGTGSYIKGTNGESQGVIPFLKIHNDQLVAVNQGGKRRGTGVAYLETWHSDILDFLELRRNTGDERRRTHDMNTANWIPDLFMKRMEERGTWTLFHSNEVPDLHEVYGKKFEDRYIAYEKQAKAGKIYGKEIPAIDLWKKMLGILFETGHPWITFKDPCNIRSPQDHVGVVHSSNLCTEITLNTNAEETAVCNLGSVLLDTHIKENGELDHEMLRETVRIAIRALDNVIDINFYPTKAAETSNKRHRPIGLGVMGLQNALYKKNISFASEEAVEFNDEFMEAIAYYAFEASSDLAKEHGVYSSYKGSKWDRELLPQDTLNLLEQERGLPIQVPRTSKMDWEALRSKIKKQGMRNSNTLAIAPTATISNIMGTSPCIEPTYKNLFVKSNLSGEFIMLNPYLVRDLKERGLWDQAMIDNLKYFDGELSNIDTIPEDIKKKYLTAFGIDFNYLIDAAGRRQKWIDQAQSVNLFLPEPDLKTLSHMYRAAWHKGLKTTYYLRTLGASNIEKATIAVKKETKGFTAAQQSHEKSADSVSQDSTEKTNKQLACSLEAMLNGGECEACQ